MKVVALVLFVCVIPLCAGAGQQAPRPGSVRLVIRDATDLAVVGASASLGSPGGHTLTAVADERGEAVFTSLAPGEYIVRVESAGFKPIELRGLRVRSGAQTNRNVALEIAALTEEIDVTPPDADRQLLDAFTEELTAEQIAALPDDPEELAQVLQQLVGADADIRVNGFAGGRLPPGAQIQDVRIRYDAAAGNGNGGPRIEVRTRPGSGRWQNTFNMNMRDDSLNARNAFSGERPSGQTRQYGWSINGPLVRNRTGFSLSIDRSDSIDQQAIRAARPDGIFSALVPLPNTNTGVGIELEHALTNTQELRAEINLDASEGRNQGLSEFDAPERAYSRTQSNGQVRIAHRSTFKNRAVNNLRVQYGWQSSDAHSVSDATTIRVLDAFTTGGAQVEGGRSSRALNVEHELEFTVRKTHQMSVGATMVGNTLSVNEVRNASGTFTFASLEMYQAGLPTTFTQRVISAQTGYSLYRFGMYVQDNYRLSRNVMLNMTLRHDAQTKLSDWANFSPRMAANWTLPGRRTTLRASIGVWPIYFEGGTYEQSLWSNGLIQRDIVISAPGYPDPFAGGVPLASQPPSIVRARSDIVMPYTRRASVGVDRTLTSWARLRASYSRSVGRHLFRSRDVNAPVDGVRPDPSARNISEIETSARSRTDSLELNVSLTHQPRRFSANIGYTLGESLNETDGPLTLPPNSFDLTNEWGASRQDVRHRLQASMNTDLPAGFRMNMNLRAQSASPYNITTGLDENRDGNTNERPAGLGRNAGRGAATTSLDMGITWGRALGQRTVAEPRGGNRNGRNTNSLFRFEVFARASNVLNLVTPQNFSGVQTSPFFGKATSAAAARRVVMGMRAFF